MSKKNQKMLRDYSDNSEESEFQVFPELLKKKNCLRFLGQLFLD
jgi:hypothetical protein